MTNEVSKKSILKRICQLLDEQIILILIHYSNHMNRTFFPGLLLLFLLSCNNNSEKIKPSVETISESVYASGIIKSKNQYQVFASVMGIVDQVFVTEGDSVKPGSAILLISNEASKLSTENAKLAAEFSDANSNTQKLKELKLAIDLARLKMNNDSLILLRQKKLWSEKVGSKIELEQRELAYENSLTAYESAQLRYNDLKKQITFNDEQSKKNLGISKAMESDFLVKSKINGKVYGILKEKGELVSTQTPVAVIGDAEDFILELQIDEYDIVKVKTGQQVFVNLDSYKGEIFEAIITKINPMMNERSKTFTVEATFVRQPPVLYPNLTLEASVLIRSKENALTIPRNYIFENEYVMKSNGDKIKVEIGLKDYQKAEILSGLSQDDELIIPEN